MFGFAAMANAWAMRGQHFGWVALSGVVALAVALRPLADALKASEQK